MDPAAITNHLTEAFDGVEAVEAWGTAFFYVRPSSPPAPQDSYFATIKTSDDEYDSASRLDRPDVYRLSIGVGRETFAGLFDGSGEAVAEPAGEGATADPTELDRLMPHPLYASASWVCVLSPSRATYQRLQSLLTEAYRRAAERVEKRQSRQAG